MMQTIRQVSLPLKYKLLKRVCDRLVHTANSGKTPGKIDIAYLAAAWGNPGYAAGISYLRHVANLASCIQGPILECGSGATTLLIASLTRSKNKPFTVFEHNEQWYQYLKRILDQLEFNHVQLIHAPLTSYGNYHWYHFDTYIPDENIELVICDGPPHSTPGGRYGLLPVMGQYLSNQCTILLDDTHRQAERRIIDIWSHHHCISANPIGRLGTYTQVEICNPVRV